MKPKKPKPSMAKQKRKHGPEPERLKIEGDWIAAVDAALTVKRPPGAWPK
jgi:hypothetical protein